MSSVVPFSFNAVELYIVTINEKPWTRAKEVSKAPRYNKKTANIVKSHCSKKNYAQKYQMSGVHLWIGQITHKSSTFTSKKRGCMSYCFLVNSQKQKALRSTAVINYFLMCNSNLQTRCRKSIILSLKNMSRQLHCSMMIYRKETIRYKPFQCENVALRAQRDAYQAQLQRCEDTITHHR